eukprot:m.62749 g.62749  ORF g.62749 m.62749 type:complete len:467 (+) comp9626_c0_seq1:559-1959(+)
MSRLNVAVVAWCGWLAGLGVAQRTEVPWGGGGCLTEEDCSLGGVCNIPSPGRPGKCSCDPWFTGLTCNLLNLQRPENDQLGLCHSGFDSYHSWGGRAIPAASGPNGATEWHLYASFLCEHNTLQKWTTMSSSGHFVGESAVGPFKFAKEQCNGPICTPAIIPWSHNTVAIHDPTPSTSSAQKWQIWHIGDGVVNASVFSPCFNASEVGAASATPNDHLDHVGVDGVTANRQAGATAEVEGHAAPNAGAEVFISTGPTPGGPWTRAFANRPLNILYDPAGAWPQSATNPSPLVLPNGSVRLYFTAADNAAPCGLYSNCIGVAQSDHGWEGPFVPSPHHLSNVESEDPNVFVDPRGNYHLLTNINTGHARCPQGVECGGHAWSRDGLAFSDLYIGAFGPYVTFANGTGWNNSYSERPLVTQNEDGSPLAFYVGLGRTSYMDCCNWAQLFCTRELAEAGGKCGPTLRPR